MGNNENVSWEECLDEGKIPRVLDIQPSFEIEKEEGEITENENETKTPVMCREEVVDALKNLERRMEIVELNLAAVDGGKLASAKGRIITSGEMESMVKKAVSLGPNYGVGRGFIKTHLHRELGVPDSQYYIKRVNQVIRNLVARCELAFDEQFQLYKNV